MIEALSNPAHLHLLLNHVPTVGFVVALALFVIAIVGKSDDLTRVSLGLLFIIAVVSIATYVTGNAADSLLRGTAQEPAYPADVSQAAIRSHEDAALLAFAFMELTGLFALLALWQWRLASELARWNIPVVLVLSIVTFGLMARAADRGGEIMHPEIRSAQEAAAFDQARTPGGQPATGTARSIGLWIVGQRWVWPTSETLHFVGLCMLFTVVLVVDLRMLGMIRSVSLAAVYQMLPIGILGFGINLITGMVFFVGAPGQYVHNITFFWKIVFILIGGLNVLYFMLVDRAWTAGLNDEIPVSSRVAAASAIVIWAAVLFCGHMLPFIGNAF